MTEPTIGIDSTIKSFVEYGILGVIIMILFGMLWYILKENGKREDKLYAIIDSLSSQLPLIREAIGRIEKKIM